MTSGAWRPDGTRLLTTSWDSSARVWDAATGQPVGWQLDHLPGSELAVWSSPEHKLLGPPGVDDQERGSTSHDSYSHTRNSEKAQGANLGIRIRGGTGHLLALGARH